MATPGWSGALLSFLLLLGMFGTGHGQVPVFEPPTFNLSLSEAVPIYSSVAQVKAQGDDVRYFMDEQSSEGHFEVGLSNGTVYTNKQLDREETPAYTLLVRAANAGGTSTATIYVTVTDVNDNSPSFQVHINIFRLNEGSELQRSVGTVQASDRDEPGTPNSKMTYAIGDDPDAAWFDLNPTTGELTTKRPVDYERKRIFRFFVLARDQAASGSRIGTTTVTVSILDLEEKLTSDEAYSVTIPETTPVRDVILNVTLKNDTSPNVTFSLEEGDCKFDINASTGQLFTTSLLDWTEQHVYNMTLYVEEPGQFGQRSDPVPVSVTVLRNLEEVSFPISADRITVQANVTPGTVIYTANATDNDSQDTLVYTLTGDEQAQQFYAIEPGTGAVRLKRSLAEGTQTYDLLAVEVTDGGVSPNKDWTVVHITIERDSGTSDTTSPAPGTSSGALSTGASIGIGVVIGIVICAVIAALAYLLLRRRVPTSEEDDNSNDVYVHYDNVGQQPAAGQAAREEERHYSSLQQEMRDIPRDPSDYAVLDTTSGPYESPQ